MQLRHAELSVTHKAMMLCRPPLMRRWMIRRGTQCRNLGHTTCTRVVSSHPSQMMTSVCDSPAHTPEEQHVGEGPRGNSFISRPETSQARNPKQHQGGQSISSGRHSLPFLVPDRNDDQLLITMDIKTTLSSLTNFTSFQLTSASYTPTFPLHLPPPLLPKQNQTQRQSITNKNKQ
jgi:hypothetical protein